MSLPGIIDGIVATLTSGGVRATSDPSSWSAPCVVVDMPEEIDLRETFGGARRYVLPLLVIIPTSDPRSARLALEEMIGTLTALIEADPQLDGSCDSASPIDVTTPVVQELQGVPYLTFSLRIEVLD